MQVQRDVAINRTALINC